MNSEIKGNIFDIQHFSVGDGPGIRTTVFLKGCPLHCEWCHNPESKKCEPQVMYNAADCVYCAACVEACPNACHKIDGDTHSFDAKGCTACGKCVEACRFDALEVVGKAVSVESVLREVMEDAVFYGESGGGMTLSGGEPLYQPEFATALARAAKGKGIHVAVETSGLGKTEDILALSEYTDLFLFDYKATGADHKKFIGADSDLIQKNLFALDERGAQLILRCPIVPDRNLTDEHIDGIIDVARRLKNLVEINLEPYHNIGIGKAQRLGIGAGEKITPPSKETMRQIAERIENKTAIKTVVM